MRLTIPKYSTSVTVKGWEAFSLVHEACDCDRGGIPGPFARLPVSLPGCASNFKDEGAIETLMIEIA